jgi:hypothetical protein
MRMIYTESRMAKKKNEAAAELGRLRAKKLGPKRVREIATKASHARENAISPERRSEIAKKAADARWGNKRSER